MEIEEAKEAATALLATVKKLMTGREIEACEWAKSDEMETDVEREIRYLMRDAEHDRRYDYRDAEVLALRDMEEIRVLQLLKNQFPREIADWINKRNAARSRKAVATFQRISLAS